MQQQQNSGNTLARRAPRYGDAVPQHYYTLETPMRGLVAPTPTEAAVEQDKKADATRFMFPMRPDSVAVDKDCVAFMCVDGIVQAPVVKAQQIPALAPLVAKMDQSSRVEINACAETVRDALAGLATMDAIQTPRPAVAKLACAQTVMYGNERGVEWSRPVDPNLPVRLAFVLPANTVEGCAWTDAALMRGAQVRFGSAGSWWSFGEIRLVGDTIGASQFKCTTTSKGDERLQCQLVPAWFLPKYALSGPVDISVRFAAPSNGSAVTKPALPCALLIQMEPCQFSVEQRSIRSAALKPARTLKRAFPSSCGPKLQPREQRECTSGFLTKYFDTDGTDPDDKLSTEAQFNPQFNPRRGRSTPSNELDGALMYTSPTAAQPVHVQPAQPAQPQMHQSRDLRGDCSGKPCPSNLIQCGPFTCLATGKVTAPTYRGPFATKSEAVWLVPNEERQIVVPVQGQQVTSEAVALVAIDAFPDAVAMDAAVTLAPHDSQNEGVTVGELCTTMWDWFVGYGIQKPKSSAFDLVGLIPDGITSAALTCGSPAFVTVILVHPTATAEESEDTDSDDDETNFV